MDEGGGEASEGGTVAMWVPKDELKEEVYHHEHSCDICLLIFGPFLPRKGREVVIDDLGARAPEPSAAWVGAVENPMALGIRGPADGTLAGSVSSKDIRSKFTEPPTMAVPVPDNADRKAALAGAA